MEFGQGTGRVAGLRGVRAGTGRVWVGRWGYGGYRRGMGCHVEDEGRVYGQGVDGLRRMSVHGVCAGYAPGTGGRWGYGLSRAGYGHGRGGRAEADMSVHTRIDDDDDDRNLRERSGGRTGGRSHGPSWQLPSKQLSKCAGGRGSAFWRQDRRTLMMLCLGLGVYLASSVSNSRGMWEVTKIASSPPIND